MSILMLGDIHGSWLALKNALKKAADINASAVIQVGDFGLFDVSVNDVKDVFDTTEFKGPVFFIDGNHDDCTKWIAHDVTYQVFPDTNLFYMPRGSVREIDGKTIAFMGGAASIDKELRVANRWQHDDNENIRREEIDRMKAAMKKHEKIDMFVTHVPPQFVIDLHFDPTNMLRFGVGLDWRDHNATIIENLWTGMIKFDEKSGKLQKPVIYSGHMHRSVKSKYYNILDINEMIVIK